jgi:hypothetical protein
VDDLLRHEPNTLCGLSVIFFYDPESRRAWRYVYPDGARPWVSGGTFCYRKSLWERHPFPDLNEGADTRYVWGLPDIAIRAHENPTFYIATVHRSNTSPRRLHDSRYQVCSSQEIESLLGEDLGFYRNWPLRG